MGKSYQQQKEHIPRHAARSGVPQHLFSPRAKVVKGSSARRNFRFFRPQELLMVKSLSWSPFRKGSKGSTLKLSATLARTKRQTQALSSSRRRKERSSAVESRS